MQQTYTEILDIYELGLIRNGYHLHGVVELRIEFSYTPGRPQTWEDPEEPESLDIESMTAKCIDRIEYADGVAFQKGETIDVTTLDGHQQLLEKYEQQLLENIENYFEYQGDEE